MFYVWIGQKNTTTGQPNKRSGRLSLYGDLFAFDTRSERDHFYNNSYSRKAYTTIERTNLKDAKSYYFAGLNIDQYNDYIKYVNNGYINPEDYQIETFEKFAN